MITRRPEKKKIVACEIRHSIVRDRLHGFSWASLRLFRLAAARFSACGPGQRLICTYGRSCNCLEILENNCRGPPLQDITAVLGVVASWAWSQDPCQRMFLRENFPLLLQVWMKANFHRPDVARVGCHGVFGKMVAPQLKRSFFVNLHRLLPGAAEVLLGKPCLVHGNFFLRDKSLGLRTGFFATGVR